MDGIQRLIPRALFSRGVVFMGIVGPRFGKTQEVQPIDSSMPIRQYIALNGPQSNSDVR